MQHCFHVVFYIIGIQYLHVRHPGRNKSFRSSELVSNGYISNHNKVRRPRPKFNCLFSFIFLLFLIQCYSNKLKTSQEIQRFISDSCFQLKSWFNVDARAPSIPLLNFPFKKINMQVQFKEKNKMKRTRCEDLMHHHTWLLNLEI